MCYANVPYPISFYSLWEGRNSALLVASESSLLWGQVLSESSLKLKGLSDNFWERRLAPFPTVKCFFAYMCLLLFFKVTNKTSPARDMKCFLLERELGCLVFFKAFRNQY